jgi:RNA polymerase sigma-70 factor (ECF subfamily)
MQQNDLNLAEALALIPHGDRGAFRRAHDLTRRHLLGIALRVVGQRELAEDVLQEVYLRLWTCATQYDARVAQPMTWLITIVRNRAIDALRARRSGMQRWVEEGHMGIDDTSGETVDDGYAAPDDRAAHRLDAARLDRHLRRLAPWHRQSLVLVHCHGLTFAEAALRLGAPCGSVKAWVQRGLAHLRRSMAPQPA